VTKPEAKPAKKVVKKAEKKETAKKEERKEKRKTAKNKTTRASEVSSPDSPKFAKCLNKHCNSSAKQNSKYCSHKCGVSVALENLKKKEEKRSDDNEYSLEDLRKELRLKIHGLRQSREESNGDVMLQGAGVLGTTSVAEIEDLNALEDIDRKKKEIEKGLLSLAKKAEELETAIEIAASLSTANVRITYFRYCALINILRFLCSFSHALFVLFVQIKHDKAGVKPETRDTMDCHSCGKPIAAATFARHLEQCSLVKERSKSAGGRNRLCGCPTNDVECGYCVVPKESCGKHIGWEGLRKAELVQEKNQLTETVEALTGEEQIIKLRISRRRQASSSEQHRTIVERTPPNHLFSIVPQITPPKHSLPTPTSTPSLAAPVVTSPSPSSSASITTSTHTPAQLSSSAISSSSSPSSCPSTSTSTSTTTTSTPPTPHSSLDTAVPPSPAETPKATETALASSTPPTAVATS
jgi:hypothetical protein